MNNWLVIRTRPRWEKKVAQLLCDKGVETFCPLLKDQRQWSDRTKTIEEPLLKSYIFVKIREDQRTYVRLTEGVMNFVYENGKQIVIREKVIQHIKHLQQAYQHLRVVEEDSRITYKDCLTDQSPNKNNIVSFCIKSLNVKLVAFRKQLKFIAVPIDKNH